MSGSGTAHDPTVLLPGDHVVVEPQNPFTSVTVWGLVISGLAYFLAKWGVDLNGFFERPEVQALLQALGLGGGAVALFGRTKANRPLGFAAQKRTVVGVILILFMLTLSFGCQSAQRFELIAVRDGMHQPTMWQQHLDWADKLTIDPATGRNHADQIAPLSANDNRAIHQTYDAVENLYNTSKAKDGEALNPFYVPAPVPAPGPTTTPALRRPGA